jgi:hypothetical protein
LASLGALTLDVNGIMLECQEWVIWLIVSLVTFDVAAAALVGIVLAGRIPNLG